MHIYEAFVQTFKIIWGKFSIYSRWRNACKYQINLFRLDWGNPKIFRSYNQNTQNIWAPTVISYSKCIFVASKRRDSNAICSRFAELIFYFLLFLLGKILREPCLCYCSLYCAFSVNIHVKSCRIYI